ncbi:MAG: ABC transporter permease [Bacillota bacterium]
MPSDGIQAVTVGARERPSMSWGQVVWRKFRRHRLALAGAVIIILLYIVAIFAPFLAPYDPYAVDPARRLELPSAAHPMGLDELGRDVLSRVMYGTRVSLTVGFIAAGISLVVGVFLGALGGYYGGVVDNVIMRIVDVLMSVPEFLLIIAIVAAVGPSLTTVMLVIGLTHWSGYARVTRGSVLSLRSREFVEAARALGGSNLLIILKHIVPNCLAPVIVLATLNVAGAILIESSLSFLGFGAQPPTASWGSILNAGRQYMRRAPHIALFPGLAITITVLAFNLLGDGLRDALDPKMKT